MRDTSISVMLDTSVSFPGSILPGNKNANNKVLVPKFMTWEA